MTCSDGILDFELSRRKTRVSLNMRAKCCPSNVANSLPASSCGVCAKSIPEFDSSMHMPAIYILPGTLDRKAPIKLRVRWVRAKQPHAVYVIWLSNSARFVILFQGLDSKFEHCVLPASYFVALWTIFTRWILACVSALFLFPSCPLFVLYGFYCFLKTCRDVHT